jgi:hypothetical protein
VTKFGKFVTQVASYIAHALAAPKCDERTKTKLLQLSIPILDCIPLVAVFAKCSKPLQLEKIAANIIQKHVDAGNYTSVLAAVESLVEHLISESASRTVDLTVNSDPAAMCVQFSAAAGDSIDMSLVMLLCLQAQLTCCTHTDAVKVIHLADACRSWVDHINSLDETLGQKYCSNLVRAFVNAAQTMANEQKNVLYAFLCCQRAIEVLLPFKSSPVRKGLSTCMDHMIKIESTGLVGHDEDIDNAYRIVMDRLFESGCQSDWIAPELFKLIERANGRSSDVDDCASKWEKFVSWCEGMDHSTCTTRVMQAAASLNHGMLVLDTDAATAFLAFSDASSLLKSALDACLPIQKGEALKQLPDEYTALLRLLSRGATFTRVRELLAGMVRSYQVETRASEEERVMTPVLSSVAVDIANLVAQGHAWEQANIKLLKAGVKFGRLGRLRLDNMHMGAVLWCDTLFTLVSRIP